MSRVEIVPIELPRDAGKFVKSWWKVYEGDPHWVPPLVFERKQFFDPRKNPYHAYADIQCFMALRDGEPVGTISAQVDHRYQDMESGVGFFGFFEVVDDHDVAQALFDAACDWLRAKGMREVRGPFNFNTNHEFGCLIDGFDTDPCIANPHSRQYFGSLYESCGLRKSKDWYAYWIAQAPIPKDIENITKRVLRRYPNIELRQVDPKNWDREVELFREIYNDAWSENWGHVHLSDEEFDVLAKGFKQILDPKLAWFAFVDGEAAALALTLPDYNQVAKKMNGRLFPFGWWHFLRASSTIDQIRVFILGVKKKYQHMPIGAPLYMKTWEEGRKMNIKGAEASLILEDNYRMRGALEKLGAEIYKTYRIYEMPLGGSEATDPS